MASKEINTAVVLSNATQLGVEVLMRVSRANISGAVGGQFLTRTACAAFIAQSVREKAFSAAITAKPYQFGNESLGTEGTWVPAANPSSSTLISTSASMQLVKERAAELVARGINLRAKANTPLLELVSFTTPTIVSDANTGNYDFTEVQSSSEHTPRLEQTAQFVADRVSDHINYARNVVSPALENILKQVSEGIESLAIDPYTGYKVKELSYPPVLDLEQFQELLQKFDTGTNVVPTASLKYPAYTNEQIIEACHTGSANIDSLIDEWLGSLPEGKLQSIWQSVFQNKIAVPPTAEIESLQDMLRDFDNALPNAVVIFMLAERLSQDIGSDCGMELGEARDLFFAIKQACVTAVRRGVLRYESYMSTKTVVSVYDKLTRTVHVNKNVYREWIAGGGSVEVLFGFLTLGKNMTSASELTAGAEEALEAWRWHSTVLQSEKDARFTAEVKELACQVFEQELNGAISEGEQEALNSISNKNQLCNEFRKLMGEITSAQIRSNWKDCVWRAACQSRFFYTSALDFLSEVNYEVNERACEPQDAATKATISYVGKYIADMVEVFNN